MDDMFLLFGDTTYEGPTFMGLYTKIDLAVENCRKYREKVKNLGFDWYFVTKVTPDQPYDYSKIENVVARFDARHPGDGWQFTKV